MAARRLDALIAIVGTLQRAGTEDAVVAAVLPELVKATGFGRLNVDPGPVMQRILDVNPHAPVFGTDLPSTRAPRPFADADLTGLADLLGPDHLDNVLWHNAAALYRLRD